MTENDVFLDRCFTHNGNQWDKAKTDITFFHGLMAEKESDYNEGKYIRDNHICHTFVNKFFKSMVRT